MKIVIVVAVVLAISMPIMAQNLLSNGSFDTDVSVWENPYSNIVNWDSLDANSSASSGSAALTNDLMNNGTTAMLYQCIEVSAGDLVEVKAKIYHPSGQSGEGNGSLRVNFFSDTSCGTSIGSSLYANAPSDFDTWHETGRTDFAPENAASVRLFLAVRGLSGGTQFTAHFDDVVLTATAGVIFTDGFENGDTNAWSPATF